MPTKYFRFYKDAIAIGALLALIAAFFHTLPAGYWRADDPALLLHALQSEGLRAFYDPFDWQKISTSNLTPWLIFSFKTDIAIAGLQPKFFYLHSLLLLALVTTAAYGLARMWLVPVWAFLASVLFLVGAPTASVTELLMTRHYMEGLFFALLSSTAFVYAVRRQNILWAVAGALLYALAATAKEIYVPLVLVLPLIPPIGRMAERLRLASPYIAVAALYVAWRHYMLGSMVGGYVDSQSLVSMQSATKMLAAIGQFPSYFFGSHWVFPIFLLGCVWIVAALMKPRSIPVFMTLAVCTIGPLIPLASFPGISGPDRYLFLLWFVVSFTTVFAIHTLTNGLVNAKGSQLAFPAGIATTLFLLIFSFSNESVMQKQRSAMQQEFDVQGRFYYQMDDSKTFVPTPALLASYWYVTSLCKIKKLLAMQCPVALIQGLPQEKAVGHLYAYDADQGTMSELLGSHFDERILFMRMNTTKPLSAALSIVQGWGRWQLGPHTDGQYYFASESLGRFPVSRQGVLRTPLTDLSLYIHYESPEGWTTSSPLLAVSTDRAISWSR